MIKRLTLLFTLCLILTLSQTAWMNGVSLENIVMVKGDSQEFIQGLDASLADYFFRIGVLDEAASDLTVLVDWPWYEDLFARSLPNHTMKDSLKWSEELDMAQVLAQVLYAMDQEEFAYTYDNALPTPEKFLSAAEVIGFYGAKDNPHPTLKSVLTSLLLARADLGYYHPYLGHINDGDVYRLARAKKDSIDRAYFLGEVPALFDLGVKGLEGISGGTFTGYNVKSYNENPVFSTDYTIRYDHGNMGHLLQMITLLRREEMDVRVSVKGRISSYVHHIDQWGEPNWSAVTARIDEQRVVVSSNSFDILLEFSQRKELEAFKGVVDEYARRKEQDTYGLIRAPYYAPVYASTQALPGYEAVIDLRISSNGFYLQSYVLVEYFEEVLSSMKEYVLAFPEEMVLEYSTYYVNPEFTNYLRNNLQY